MDRLPLLVRRVAGIAPVAGGVVESCAQGQPARKGHWITRFRG